jgi:hypothetical protein
MSSETQDAADAPAGVFFSRDPIFGDFKQCRLQGRPEPQDAILCPTCSLKNGFMRGGWKGFCGSPENTKNWFWVSVMFPISVTFVSQHLSTDVPLLVDFTHDFPYSFSLSYP